MVQSGSKENRKHHCVMWGFRCEADENCVLVGHYAASSGSSFRRFGTTRPSEFLTLKMVLIGCLETSLRNCHYSLRNDPGERNSRKYYCRALTEMFRFKGVNTAVSQLLASLSSLLLFFRHLVPQVDLYFSVRRIILEIAFIYVLVIPGAAGHITKNVI